MAALICDICGGQLSMDASGDFAVCESCGMKHTKDRVKAKVQEITGTVKIDDTDMVQEQVSNWETMASAAYDNSNYSEAYTYYCKILEKRVDYWMATFRKGMCQGWESTLANIRANEVLGGVVDATKLLISDTTQSDVLKANGRMIMAVEVYNWIQAVNNMVVNHANEYAGELVSAAKEFYARERLVSEIMKFVLTMVDEQTYEYYEDKKGLANFLNSVMENGRTVANNMDSSFRIKTGSKWNSFWQVYDDVYENVAPDFQTNSARSALISQVNVTRGNLNTWKENFERKQALIAKKEKEERIAKYWAEHAEERKELVTRLDTIEEELRPLKEETSLLEKQYNEVNSKKHNPVAVEGELLLLKQKKNDLQHEKSSLGLFAGKRKKELAEEIAKVENQTDKIEEIAKQQRKELVNSVDVELAPIEEKLSPLNQQIQNLEREKQTIKTELTKDR